MAFGDIIQTALDARSIATGGDTCTPQFASPVQAGSLLFMYFVRRADLNQTWGTLPHGMIDLLIPYGGGSSFDSSISGNGGSMAVAYKIADGTEGTDFTAQLLGGSDRERCLVAEIELYGAGQGATLVDGIGIDDAAGSLSINTGSVTTLQTDNILIGCANKATGSATPIDIPAGWDLIEQGRTDGSFGPQSIMVKKVVGAGTNSVTFTHVQSGGWGTFLGAFWSGVEADDVRGVIATGWAS